MKKIPKRELEMLRQSNNIEREYSERAFIDSQKAWLLAEKNITKEMKFHTVMRIHEVLLKNISPGIAGKLRDCDVFIGGHRKIFVSEFLLRKYVTDFCSEYNKIADSSGNLSIAKLEDNIKKNHILFENIHPFVDGNGRTGRILYNLLRKRVGLDVHVIHGIESGETRLPDEQVEYYSWFG